MLRGDPAPGFKFDAITGVIAGRASVQVNVGHYGYAQGAPNSDERMGQCRSLERLNYPLVRRLRGYQSHLHHPNLNSEWRTFFANLHEGASIYHSILGHCSQDAEPLPGLTSTQTRSGLIQGVSPEGWIGGNAWKEDLIMYYDQYRKGCPVFGERGWTEDLPQMMHHVKRIVGPICYMKTLILSRLQGSKDLWSMSTRVKRSTCRCTCTPMEQTNAEEDNFISMLLLGATTLTMIPKSTFMLL